MVYDPTDWEDSPSTATPINAARLNKMETGIDEAHTHLDNPLVHLNAEQIRDLIATFIVAGANVTLTHNDAGDTLTIAATTGSGGLTLEEVQDAVNTMLIAGTNVTKTYDDVAGTITIEALNQSPRDPNYTRTYILNTATTTTEPITSQFKVNNSTAASITTLVISETDGEVNSAVNWLDSIRANDILEFSSDLDPTKWWRLEIVSVVDNGTWRTYTVTNGVSGSGGLPTSADYVYITRIPSKAVSSATYQGSVTFGIVGAATLRTGTARIYNDSGRTRTITSVRLSANTAPSGTTSTPITGAAMVGDVNKGGTSIFTTTANRPAIPNGSNTHKTTGIGTSTWEDGTYLTADIDFVGSTTAGSDVTLTVEWS